MHLLVASKLENTVHKAEVVDYIARKSCDPLSFESTQQNDGLGKTCASSMIII
jgi:hypothetical protein